MFTVQGSLGAVPEYKNTGTPQKLGTKLVSKDKIGVSFAANIWNFKLERGNLS